MNHQAGVDPAYPNAGQLLGGDLGEPDVPRGATVLLGVAQPQQTHCGSFGPELYRNFTRLIPILGVGHDLCVNETP